MRGKRLILGGAVLALAALASGCGAETAPAKAGSGVTGVVSLGPQCPVEIEGQPCPDVPATGVRVSVSVAAPGESYAAGDPVAQTTTDDRGRYRVAVPPGSYVITADAGMSCELLDAVVTAGGFTEVEVPCDTGIR